MSETQTFPPPPLTLAECAPDLVALLEAVRRGLSEGHRPSGCWLNVDDNDNRHAVRVFERDDDGNPRLVCTFLSVPTTTIAALRRYLYNLS